MSTNLGGLEAIVFPKQDSVARQRIVFPGEKGSIPRGDDRKIDVKPGTKTKNPFAARN